MKNTKLGSVQIYYSTYNKTAVLEKLVIQCVMHCILFVTVFLVVVDFFLPITGE